jgi:hypothetical protein
MLYDRPSSVLPWPVVREPARQLWRGLRREVTGVPGLADWVVLVRLDEGPAPGPAGVLVRLDRPVAAYADPVVVRWLETGEAGAGLSAQSRAQCVAVWGQAGLIAGASHDLASRALGSGDGDVMAEHAARLAQELPGAVLAVGVAAACSFCAQLAADLAANAAFWERAGFGVVLASQDHARRLGRVPDALVPALAALACMAARHGTPSGMLLQPGVQPRAVTGYDQVSAALAGMSGARVERGDRAADIVLSNCDLRRESGGAFPGRR